MSTPSSRSALAVLAVATALLLSLLGYRANCRITQEGDPSAWRPDTLRAVTLSGSTLYFQYRGEDMGYQYELLRSFAEHSGIPFTLTTVPDIDSIHRLLSLGQVHLSITPEAVSQRGQAGFEYVGPELEQSMVLVQRKPSRGNTSPYIEDVTQLLGQTVYVLSGTHYARRLETLEEQLGGQIDIVEIKGDTLDAEDLISRVALDSISYTVVSDDLAQVIRPYYPNIDTRLKIGFVQRLRWLMPKGLDSLSSYINTWSEGLATDTIAQHIYRKYFEMNPVHTTQTPVRFTIGKPLGKGAISHFDELFRKHIKGLPASWHLLASIAYQESNFNADIVGWSGARGLMGIMPNTGRIYGASREALLDPETSIRVSMACLLDNERSLRSISNDEERLRFTLAAYNAGLGHVQDAQRLAQKYGHNPEVWQGHVERYILLKSERRYYTDPVCKHGYLRGKETYNYVREVMARYHAYRGY